MELVGRQLRLRPLLLADLKHMVVWNGDAELQSFVDCDLPVDLTDLEEWYRTNVPDRHYQIFGIEKEGRLIGDLELDHINWRKREAELRIRIGDKQFWGQGLGSEALCLIFYHLFMERQFQRIYLRVYEFNKRAIRCYLKNGFKQTGLLHRYNQDWKDIILMEINFHTYRRLCARSVPNDGDLRLPVVS